MKQVKKILPLLMILTLVSGLAALDLKLGAGLNRPTEGNFRDIYGQVVPVFEARASIPFGDFLHFWLAGDYLAASGEIPQLQEELQYRQLAFSGGIGTTVPLSRKSRAVLQAGVKQFFLEETGFQEKVSLNSFGFCAGFDLEWQASELLLVYLGLRYSRGEADYAGEKKLVGGPSLTAGIGFDLAGLFGKKRKESAEIAVDEIPVD